MNAKLKSIAESVLLHGGPARISRLRHRHRALILAYHNVVPDGQPSDGDASLHLPLAAFQAQLAALQDSVDVVPLGELLDGSSDRSATRDRPRVAITFDDAYSGAVTVGLREIAAREMSATMFVSPGRLNGDSFWWDRFAAPMGSSGGDGFRERALEEWGGVEERVAGRAAERGRTEIVLPDLMRTATEDQLARAADLTGVSLGSHSWSHPNLTSLDDAELETELVRPLHWLTARYENAFPWLSYPYGIVDGRVAAAAAAAGYEAALRIDGGWMPRGATDRYMLPRLNVPAGVSETGFRCRLAGLLSTS